jgi:hypothetical protein
VIIKELYKTLSRKILLLLSATVLLFFILVPSTPAVVSAASKPNNSTPNSGKYTCGSGKNEVKTKFNFGCLGKGNPIVDVLFALLRFLSIGVGVVVAMAIILSGIQYATSEGNPEQTAKAKDHIKDAIFALLIYMFIFSILQYLVPGGLFNPQ